MSNSRKKYQSDYYEKNKDRIRRNRLRRMEAKKRFKIYMEKQDDLFYKKFIIHIE